METATQIRRIHKAAALLLLLAVLPLILQSGCEDDSDSPGISAIFRQTFDGDPDGTYSLSQLNSGWNGPAWSRGIRTGRVTIISGSGAFSGKSMSVAYPDGAVGVGSGGASWPVAVGGPHERLLCSYRFRFAPGFDFVRGGKLPGLAGGAANDGGRRPNGRDGWSARLMWHSGGRLSAYVYHPDQPSRFGEHFFFSANASPGSWHKVTMRVTMNTPGMKDGSVECWLNGDKVLTRHNLRFRDVPSFGIDQFFFSTFFGGSGSSWAPTRNETITFDDFIVGN